MSETAFPAPPSHTHLTRQEASVPNFTTCMSGMTLNKICSAKTPSPSRFCSFGKDNRMALETLHPYSIWFNTARSGQRRRRQLLYKRRAFASLLDRYHNSSRPLFSTQTINQTQARRSISTTLEPPPLSRTNTHTTMLSCCSSDRKYKKVASEEDQQQQRKKDQTTAEQDYLDQIKLEDYMNKRLAGPPRSNLALSSGLRRNHYLR